MEARTRIPYKKFYCEKGFNVGLINSNQLLGYYIRINIVSPLKHIELLELIEDISWNRFLIDPATKKVKKKDYIYHQEK